MIVICHKDQGQKYHCRARIQHKWTASVCSILMTLMENAAKSYRKRTL